MEVLYTFSQLCLINLRVTAKYILKISPSNTIIGWTAIKFGTDVNVALRMNCMVSSDLSSGQNFTLSNILVYDQNTCKATDITISLSSTLYLVLINKCWHN